AERFAAANFPEPHRREGEHENRPFHYRKAMTERLFPEDGGAHCPRNLSANDWQQIYAATYGMVSLIDECVGRVLACLEAEGLSGDTVVLFTADHGDLLGDHFFLYKGPFPCRSLLNVPFILAGPGCCAGETQAVMSNVDVMPTLLDLVGLAPPATVQGRSFKPVISKTSGMDEAPALCCGWSKDSPRYYHQSLYFLRNRISYFPLQDDGELYDLERDPHELCNLYHAPEQRALRDELLRRLLRELGRAEPGRPPVIAPW
ncbi:MAG: sulfatase-like hydrolase/transferase, partial [Lentisphaerae bacterium]|nr:sulfatase-like hydrolase/transferase [Lentisphaerota bacterium]